MLFFKNKVGRGAVLNKVISDVNNTFGDGVNIGLEGKSTDSKAAVIGWNNDISPGTVIGSGAIVYPSLESEKIPSQVEPGEVVR